MGSASRDSMRRGPVGADVTPLVGSSDATGGGLSTSRSAETDAFALVNTSRSRFSTNWRSNFVDTSSSTPRPNWATLPVIARSVATSTRVPPPSSFIVTMIDAVALP